MCQIFGLILFFMPNVNYEFDKIRNTNIRILKKIFFPCILLKFRALKISYPEKILRQFTES